MTMMLSNRLHFVAELLDKLRQADGDLPSRMLPTFVGAMQDMAEEAERLEQELTHERAVDIGWLIYRSALELKNADPTNVVFFPQRARVSADAVRTAP